jgi:hypothetical protein
MNIAVLTSQVSVINFKILMTKYYRYCNGVIFHLDLIYSLSLLQLAALRALIVQGCWIPLTEFALYVRANVKCQTTLAGEKSAARLGARSI